MTNDKQVKISGVISKTAVLIYILCIFAIYPLYYGSSYLNILTNKVHFYFAVSITVIGIVIISQGIQLITEKKKMRFVQRNKESVFSGFSIPEVFAFGFGIILTISMLLSKDRKAAFLGTQGNYTGYLTLILCVVTYFLASRLLEFNQYIILLLFITSTITSFLAIGNQFGFDLLGIYENIAVKAPFISTLGNRNVFACYLSILLPLGMTLFCFCKTVLSAVIYAITCSFGFMAAIASNSDSVLLAMGVTFLVILWYAFDNWKSLLRYLILCAILFLSFFCMGRMNIKMMDVQILKFSMLSTVLTDSRLCCFMLILIAIILLFVYFLQKKNVSIERIHWIKRISFGVILVLMLLIAGYAIWLNSYGKNSNMTGISTYLHFNERWGSGRGIIWIQSIKMFSIFSVKEILFGAGPDCYGLFIIQSGKQLLELRGDWSSTSINAHNEFLQYLITTGVLGVITYFSLLLSSLIRLLKKKKSSLFCLSIGITVVSFLVQGLVNNPHVYTTPIFFLLLGIGENICRKIELGEKQ